MKGLLLNENMTLKILNGSLVIGDTTVQNQQMLLLADKSDFKQVPMRGVGARRFLESSQSDELAREIRLEFIADGMTIQKIEFPAEGQIKIDARYES